MVQYPIFLEPDDNDTVLVSFPDFPEAHTFGDDRDEALSRARDALATAIDGYIRARRPLPNPSGIKGYSAELSALMSAKVEIYNLMTSTHVTKSELARRLGCHAPQVDRLLDLAHHSRVDQLEAAAHALGARFHITVSVPARERLQIRAALPRRAKAGAGRHAGYPGVITGASRVRERAPKKK